MTKKEQELKKAYSQPGAYCHKCKKNVEEMIDEIVTKTVRVWDGDCYEEKEILHDESESKYFCRDCGEELEY